MGVVHREALPDRYRLDVMAEAVIDVVGSIGGCLFDHARAGWDVTVLLATDEDVRPLEILGLKGLNLDLALYGHERLPVALSVAANLYTTDERVRHLTHEALDCRSGEVTIWGRGQPPRLRGGITATRHNLSSAARVFKIKALAAAGVFVESVDPTEDIGIKQRNLRVVDHGFDPGNRPATGVITL